MTGISRKKGSGSSGGETAATAALSTKKHESFRPQGEISLLLTICFFMVVYIRRVDK